MDLSSRKVDMADDFLVTKPLELVAVMLCHSQLITARFNATPTEYKC